jgi:hypothetical protein
MEVSQHSLKLILDETPKYLVEFRREAIRTRRLIMLHLEVSGDSSSML